MADKDNAGPTKRMRLRVTTARKIKITVRDLIGAHGKLYSDCYSHRMLSAGERIFTSSVHLFVIFVRRLVLVPGFGS
jgi:hypothetical protein